MDIQERIGRFIGDELNVPRKDLAPDYPLVSSQVIGSTALLQVVAFVESEFAIEVDDDELELENFETISAIARLVESKLDGRSRP